MKWLNKKWFDDTVAAPEAEADGPGSTESSTESSLGGPDSPYDSQEKYHQSAKDDEISRDDLSGNSIVKYAKFTEDDINAVLPGSDADDDMPAFTLRMWTLAMVWATVIAGVDSFFNMRFPTVSISVLVGLVLSWPMGQFWYWIVPQWGIPLGHGRKIELNPGPFNYKEHGLIYIFVNVVTSAGLVNNLVIEDFKFFKVNTGIGRQILFNLSCYMMSFALIGLCRDILVTPEDRVWPGQLSRIALFKALHSRDNSIANGWKMSRWIFFVIVFFASFVEYWFPDLILPFLSTIGAWISWIRPNSAALSQVFGVKTGLGLFPLTFDWTQVTSINNPLTTPMWAVGSMFFSFVFWIYGVMPGLYYMNHWSTAHMPIMTNKVYTVDGKPYKFQEVADKNWKLDVEKFKKYSPPMLPIAFLMSVALQIGAFSSMMVHFILLFKDEVIRPWKERNNSSDKFKRSVDKNPSFPTWVYIAPLLVALGLGFAFTEGWDNAPLDAGGYIVATLIGISLFIPLAMVEARANTDISVAAFFYIVSANWYEGNPLRLLYFYTFGFGIVQHGMHMAQSAKVGHYLRIKPKQYMTMLFFSGIWASLVSPSVTGFILHHIEKGICTDHAENNMTCRKQATAFNTYGIWGLFGNHLFASGGRYVWVLYFFLVGGGVAIVSFILHKWKPNSMLARFDPVLFFAGALEIPSVTGYNFTTWFMAAFVFNFIIHRRYTAWWQKYNLVTAIGLDCGVAIAVIIIYFAVVYTGGSKHYKWWATEVSSKGCDAKGCPYKPGPMPRPTGF